MKIPVYHVDAFASRPFEGNPAAICPLESWLPDATLQAIAGEHNLSETAYYVPRGGHYELRWFTPEVEVDLCGHATVASAHVIFDLRHEVAGEGGSFLMKSGEGGGEGVSPNGTLLFLPGFPFPAPPSVGAAPPLCNTLGAGSPPGL